MEQIKDMVTLRAFALDKAIATFYGMDVDEHLGKRIIDRAKDIESYIIGDANLPESYEDKSAELFKDVMEKINKPTSLPLFMWQSPDVILPNENQDVLVMCVDYKQPLFGKYLGEDYWEVSIADVVKLSKFGEVSVVAWLPIPPYVKEGVV